jgi:hypothetical protein
MADWESKLWKSNNDKKQVDIKGSDFILHSTHSEQITRIIISILYPRINGQDGKTLLKVIIHYILSIIYYPLYYV